MAAEDAISPIDSHELDVALLRKDGGAADKAANALALEIAGKLLLGSSPPGERTKWHIADSDAGVDLAAALDKALAANALDTFFGGLGSEHPDYAALRSAYASERDPQRKAAIALNMERWRWMPRSLGRDYVLVNTASFEARMWRRGKQVGTWRVIVGKPSTPSPTFSATISGVTFNPWWDIPASIVREKGGRFPARLGYVRSAKGWRQKPGPANALGQMKLVMPNGYNVYLHDTPSRSLFQHDMRAYSHGCIRVGDALDFAAALLAGTRTREEIDVVVKAGRTATIGLSSPMPVYITYFTAAPRADGTVAILPDIYGRDAALHIVDAGNQEFCRA